MGMRKFTGPVLSEDPEENGQDEMENELFDPTTIHQWAAEKKLSIIQTSKENGY